MYWVNPRAPLLLGMIVTLTKGLECSRNHPITAWPASWNAIVLLSFSVKILFVSRPAMILSEAFSNASDATDSLLSLALIIAASFTRFAK